MTTRTLGMDKAGHFFVIRYEIGLEDRVVEELMRMADDRDTPFDWMDAACFSFEVTQAAAEDCRGDIAPDTLATD